MYFFYLRERERTQVCEHGVGERENSHAASALSVEADVVVMTLRL